MPKSANQKKMESKRRMRCGKTLGHLNPVEVRRRYIDEAEPIETIAASLGISVAYARVYVQAFGMFRDRGAIYRAGSVPKPRKGVRDPGSLRDIASRAAPAWSEEHRAKLAAAKRGKLGEQSNRWVGGHDVGGYAGSGSGKTKTYEHRVIAAKTLERPLLSEEHVHHMDKNRKNNEPQNLLVLHTSVHTKLHVAMRKDPELDQKQWLRDNNHSFEDLI